MVYHNYIKNIHTDDFIPIEGVLIDTDRVEGFEKNFNNMHVDAYIVTITDFTIREGFKEDQNSQIWQVYAIEINEKSINRGISNQIISTRKG